MSKKIEHTVTLTDSLRASIRDGVAFAVMFGAGEAYLVAYGIYLQGSALQIGVLATIPLLLGALSQLLGVRLMERTGARKRLVVKGVIFQALVWAPIAALALLVAPGSSATNLLIVLATLYFIGGHFVVPAWTSWMGNLVPPEVRGRYFGYRNRLLGIALLISMLGAGTLLHLAKSNGYTNIAFPVLFFIALLARLISAYWVSRQVDDGYIPVPEAAFTFMDFLRRAPRSNFARFTFFVGVVNFGAFIAVPYFSVYMLRELEFSYLQYSALIATALGSQLIAVPWWGHFADRFGNKNVLEISSIGVVIAPLLWIISDNFFFLTGCQILGGCIWGGFSLAVGNFLFDAVSPPKRGRCIAYLSVINSSFIVLGSLVGGQLLGFFDVLRDIPSIAAILPSSSFVCIFAFSSFVRLVMIAALLPRFSEVREVEQAPHRQLAYRLSRTYNFEGMNFGVATGIFRGASRHFKRARYLARVVKASRQRLNKGTDVDARSPSKPCSESSESAAHLR